MLTACYHVQLKETFHIVANIKAQSGFKWDDDLGADIQEESAEIWRAYELVCFPLYPVKIHLTITMYFALQKHKGSAPFRNKGWAWYTKILPLMPNAPRGANVFRASVGSQQPPEPPIDAEAEEDDDAGEKAISDWVRRFLSF